MLHESSKAVEGRLLGHVSEQQASDESHPLAISNLWIDRSIPIAGSVSEDEHDEGWINGMVLPSKNSSQRLLSRSAIDAELHVIRKRSINISLNLVSSQTIRHDINRLWT